MYTYFYRIFDKFGKRISAYAILTENTSKIRTDSFLSEFLGTQLEYHYNVYKVSQQSEAELIKSNNPFAMVVLTVRSVLANKYLDDATLMEIKLKLARRFLTMSLSKEKIRTILNFLKNYIRFANSENNIMFEKQYEQITGKEYTMGLEELILTTERKRGQMEGEKRGIRQVVVNMLRNGFSDEVIVKATVKATVVMPDYVQKIRASLKS